MLEETRALHSEWFELKRLLQPVVRRRQLWEMTHGLQSDLVKEKRGLPPAKRATLENISKPVSFDEMLAQAMPFVQRTKLDQAQYKRLVRAFYKTWEQQRKPTNTLEDLIRGRLGTVEALLKKTSSSVEKCASFLYALLRHDPQMELLSYFASHGEAQDPGDISFWINLRNEQRLPSARLGQETVIAAIEYEFFDRFDSIPSRSYLEKIALQMSSAITHAHAQIAESRLDGYSVSSRDLLMTLWLCGRVPALRQAVAAEARQALQEVAAGQNADGSWHEMNIFRGPHYENYEKEQPSSFVTALALSAMQTFLPAQFHDHQARAIGSLCRMQSREGSWTDPAVSDNGDLWATLAALGALKNAQSGELGRYIEGGETWLLSQQDSLGVWRGIPFTDPLACVLVLEYFSRERRINQPSDRFSEAAIQLLTRANDILARGHTDYADRALAIFAIHHALEFFVYGILQLPSVNIDVFTNAKQTLGLGPALSSFKSHLADVGTLQPNRDLAFRTQISDLASDRDSSVHKARDIPLTDLKKHLDTARKFMSHYSRMMMGRNILDA